MTFSSCVKVTEQRAEMTCCVQCIFDLLFHFEYLFLFWFVLSISKMFVESRVQLGNTFKYVPILVTVCRTYVCEYVCMYMCFPFRILWQNVCIRKKCFSVASMTYVASMTFPNVDPSFIVAIFHLPVFSNQLIFVTSLRLQ